MKELERVFIIDNSREYLCTFFSPTHKFSAAQCCANFNVSKMPCTEAVQKGKNSNKPKLEHPMAIPDDN